MPSWASSPSDYARKIALMGRTSANTLVRDVMTSSVLCVHSTQTSEQCMQLMTGKRLRHLPVVDDGKLLGMISIGDLVKDIISEQKFIIEQLEHYITGGRPLKGACPVLPSGDVDCLYRWIALGMKLRGSGMNFELEFGRASLAGRKARNEDCVLLQQVRGQTRCPARSQPLPMV